jgi:hypothetical protein
MWLLAMQGAAAEEELAGRAPQTPSQGLRHHTGPHPRRAGPGKHGRIQGNTTLKQAGGAVPAPWGNIPMPSKSLYAGFSAPDDTVRWNEAARRASTGEQVLLKKLLEVIKSPYDFLRHDDKYRGVLRTAEHKRSREDGWLDNLPTGEHGKVPIVSFGHLVKNSKGARSIK